MPPAPDDARAEAAVWQALVLFSTLSTAADVWHEARERRAGRDPSAQEAAAVVRPLLRQAAGTLQARLMQLQARLLRADDEGAVAALLRRYHELMTLRHVGQELHLIHQRLLSLYPDVSEALVEEARLLSREAARQLDGAGSEALGALVRRGLVFANRVFLEVA